MSEYVGRSYFDLRYAFPGYTFLLMIVLICLNQILQIFSKYDSGFFGAIFAFIYLLSGNAIGFFVSQIWYWTEECRRKKNVFELYDKIEVLDRFKKPSINKLDYSKIVIILDYLFPQHDDKELRSYVNRRWDLYNILGSTLFALWIGLIFGSMIKFLTFILGNNYFYSLLEFIKDILLTIIIPFLTFLFYNGMKKNETVHDEMTLAIINDVIKKKKISFFNKFHYYY